MPNGFLYLNSLARSISNRRVSGLVLLPYFIDIFVFNADSIDPNQTPRSVASDLGLHCLPMSLLCDAGRKWFKQILPFLGLYRLSGEATLLKQLSFGAISNRFQKGLGVQERKQSQKLSPCKIMAENPAV